MNHLTNGTVAVGAPGSLARKKAEAEDALRGLSQSELFEVLERTLTTEQKEELGESWFNLDRK